MNTKEFIDKLQKKLRTLPKAEAAERISFYLEMIDDGIEEGLSEEEAIARIGSIEEIAGQIVSEANADEGKALSGKSKLSPLEWALVIIGSPIWLPIFIAAMAIFSCVYVAVWVLIAAIWAIEAPFLIFSYISKYLLAFCKIATKCTYSFTKSGFNWLGKIFKGGNKKI